MRHPGANLITGLLTAALVTGCAPTESTTVHGPVEVPLRPSPACMEFDAPHVRPAADTGASMTITVTVPRTVLLRVDERGRIIAAATNTGCPPRTGDAVYVVAPDRSVTPSVAFDIAGTRWVGGFATPGTFEPQLSDT